MDAGRTAVDLLQFDPGKLIALGVSPIEADSMAQILVAKHTMLRYWHKLTKAGVPKDNARRIARAIAKYDVSQTLPTLHQRKLICQYCPIVCRCGLWRSGLLLTQVDELTEKRSSFCYGV
ncbi:hypothetical protein [Leptolyngbya ohadii]|uniref:hypothetical protein n=1 Tax=Leptolyngbya ohadii TaxID=1962290 RepID=UPI00117AE179|nr:hypothetical protein [Leptolyngbya ohadii]